NRSETSPSSSGISLPFPADPTPPTKPTGLSVANITETEASLSWQPSTDNVGLAERGAVPPGRLDADDVVPPHRPDTAHRVHHRGSGDRHRRERFRPGVRLVPDDRYTGHHAADDARTAER